MKNLMKYEMKNRRNLMLYGTLLFLVINIVIHLNIKPMSQFFVPSTGQKSIGMMLLYGLLSFGGFCAVLIGSIKIFSDDLFQDTSYLIFTLPKKMSTILSAKMITVCLQYAMWLLITIGFGVINSYRLMSEIDTTGLLEDIQKLIKPMTIWTIYGTIQFFMLVLMIYFALTITKSILVNNKHRRLISFIIFIGLNYCIWKLYELTDVIFPQEFARKYVVMGAETSIIVPSIVSFITSLVLSSMLFMGTSYLLEKKINI